METEGFWRVISVLAGATVASGAASAIVSNSHRLMTNAAFASAAVALGILLIPSQTRVSTLAVSAVTFCSATLIFGIISLFLIEMMPRISNVLAFPLDRLGDYPSGADVPLFVGLVFWLPSTLILYFLSCAAALALSNITARRSPPPTEGEDA